MAPTWKGRNIRARRQTAKSAVSKTVSKDDNLDAGATPVVPTCYDCNRIISRRSTRCKSCASKHKNIPKTNWPEVNLLLKMVSEDGYSKVGRALGVSDNAVRKHIKNYS